MANKKTVVQMYEELMAIPTLTEEQKNFLAKRIEITQKKNAKSADGERKPTKLQQANEKLQLVVLEELESANEPMTVAELCKATGIESGQKMTALLSPMLTERKGVPNPNGKVVRTEVKGRAYFALATED
jgi:hypothetical protein